MMKSIIILWDPKVNMLNMNILSVSKKVEAEMMLEY